MLELKNISKSFDGFRIRDIDLRVEVGDYYVILGKSGAGKTLLLEILAGLIVPDEGMIELEGRDITKQRIQDRPMGLVFQDHAIFPHFTVFGNIAYPLKRRGFSGSEIDSRIKDLAETMQITHLLNRYPDTLSGGEAQRTVLARTLAFGPRLLLLDEPLSSLDVQFKKELQALLRELNRRGQTIVHVTHDYEEALALANRVGVMQGGTLVQQGDIDRVFRNPKSKFIADFVGIKNFYHAVVEPISGKKHKLARINDHTAFYVLDDKIQGEAILTLDAQNVIISRERLESTALNNFKGTILEIIPTHNGLEVVLDIGVKLAVMISHDSFNRLNMRKDMSVWAGFKASAIRVQSL
ncbi:MAG: ATP-binding cassette domain-containing protein [Bacteroidales bacterium]|nr:ATP-binding cassette domain-containing protein [Bacteroidales bacterium]MBS3775923.1 ATP-binding cassette domain-containing protein [Bacteroidales bacterium]